MAVENNVLAVLRILDLYSVTVVQDGFVHSVALENCDDWIELKASVHAALQVVEQNKIALDAKNLELAQLRGTIISLRGFIARASEVLDTPIIRLRHTARTMQGTQCACNEVASDLERLRQSLLSVS